MEDQENAVLRSPPPSHSLKPKRPPPITPKRFSRFFTPRTASGRMLRPTAATKSGRHLREITQDGMNRRAGIRTSPRKRVLFADVTKHDSAISTPGSTSIKKRRAFAQPGSSPPQSSPCKRVRSNTSTDIPSSPPAVWADEDARHEESETEREMSPEADECLPIRRSRRAGASVNVLERSFGRMGIANGRKQRHNYINWRTQTAHFCSDPEDVQRFVRPDLPFCTTACNTNSSIAIGDENGGIRIVDASRNGSSSFSDPYLLLKPHGNAILDLAFSSDDFMLATAAGDQTARVIDVRTQLTKYVMRGHLTSIKQIRFQPGNDNVLATSARDGSIFLWDLRCSAPEYLLDEPRLSMDPSVGIETMNHKANYPGTYTTINGAHAEHQQPGSIGVPDNDRDQGSKDTNSYRRGDVSVTSLAFMSAGREHLLLSASDASTTVKLWDIRARYSRRGAPIPLSTTRQPESHSRHRQFGISSIVLGANDSRLYALARDNTVYVYATSHLMTGSAPELAPYNTSRHRSSNVNRQGLGPLYGLRHRNFHATSFYVKAAVRPARADRPELLAVGSSDRCPVIFPTDESLHTGLQAQQLSMANADFSAGPTDLPMPNTRSSQNRPGLQRIPSGLSFRMTDSIPIYSTGTPLIAGHQKEVTGLTWTYDGDLVSLSDDYTARRWREDADLARNLRTGGESGGRRWACGWADVGGDFDEDDC